MATAAKKTTKTAATSGEKYDGFTEEERAAMKDRAQELKAKTKRGKTSPEEDERDVLAKIASMEGNDRAIAERVHEIVKASDPSLITKLWYGMPAYYKNGAMICFFQDAKKFKARYATLGFGDKAKLDDGAMWPSSYALTKITPAVEQQITALVTTATS